MKKYIYIGAGGFAGAVLRYILKNIDIFHYTGKLPLNTLLINITGSFIIGLFLTLASEMWNISENLRLGVVTGFIGTYTTFSTMCKETAGLYAKGSTVYALCYILISALLGLAAVAAGVKTAGIIEVNRENTGFNTEE